MELLIRTTNKKSDNDGLRISEQDVVDRDLGGGTRDKFLHFSPKIILPPFFLAMGIRTPCTPTKIRNYVQVRDDFLCW